MKKKLNIDELKIQSFITELKPEHAQTAKGGEATTTGALTTELLSMGMGPDLCPIETVWGCPTDADGCYESGEVIGEASEVVTEYGCMLPEIVICG